MPDEDHQHHHSQHIVAWADLMGVPWRNGGGVTRQILSRRLDATGTWVPCSDDDWDWRLSIADVGSAGEFSSFTRMTRILTVIEGTSVTLTVDGRVEELERYRPFRFDGGAETRADLSHGPIRDLNVIARTGSVDATVSIEVLSADCTRLVLEGQFCVLLSGRAQVRTDGASAVGEELEHYDTVLGAATNPPMIMGDGVLAVISIAAVPGAASALLTPARTGLR